MTISTYATYRFRDKDPVIDKLRTIFQDLGDSYSHVANMAGCSETTIRNWFEGETRRPATRVHHGGRARHGLGLSAGEGQGRENVGMAHAD